MGYLCHPVAVICTLKLQCKHVRTYHISDISSQSSSSSPVVSLSVLLCRLFLKRLLLRFITSQFMLVLDAYKKSAYFWFFNRRRIIYISEAYCFTLKFDFSFSPEMNILYITTIIQKFSLN